MPRLNIRATRFQRVWRVEIVGVAVGVAYSWREALRLALRG